jgi:hypothetical protein
MSIDERRLEHTIQTIKEIKKDDTREEQRNILFIDRHCTKKQQHEML